MSQDNSTQSTTTRPKTLLGKLFALPFTLFGLACGSLILSILVELVGMSFFWQNQSWHHAEAMFYYELEQLSTSFTHSLLMNDPVQTVHGLIKEAYTLIFIKTGLLQNLQQTVTPMDSESLRKLTFKEYLNLGVSGSKAYLLAAAYTVLTFIVRVSVLILCMPLFALTMFVGLIDGLVRRDIRRFTVAHESGFIYHRARALLIPLVALPWVIYLAMPVSLSPLYIILPCAVAQGVIVCVTAGSFKKYL